MKAKCAAHAALLCAALLGLQTQATLASCDSRPGTPTNLTARNTAPGEIALNWQSVGNVHCFDIEVSRDGKVVGQSITGGNCGKTDIVFKDLSYNQNYCFRVRARTEGGTQGCISAQPSNTACSGTSNPPLTTGPRPPVTSDLFMPGREFTTPSYSRQVLARSNAEACQAMCQHDAQCQAWTWARSNGPDRQSTCDLKSVVGPTRPNPNMVSGLRDRLVVK